MSAENKSNPNGKTPITPARITKLREEVINKIAAGEVIQRPCNALKELLENSLDAKSTQIKISLRDGGISELRIEDNGIGINPSDFPLLCERFATSKLTQFSDLYSIATYGFRGEALASISFCARVCVTSKTESDTCAYRAHFMNGQMYDPNKPDTIVTNIKPSIVAGMQGTQIRVESLFYNMSLRQRALRTRSTHEYHLCLRTVACYAIHNCNLCSFAVTKLGAQNCLDLNIKQCKHKREAIKAIYGGDIGQYLRDIHKSHPKINGLVIDGVISDCDFAMNISTQNRNRKKKRIFSTQNRFEFILFVNHRLIESNSEIRKCVMSVYEAYLAKNHFPFVYLSIAIPSQFIDVNVSVTKSEVTFLHKSEVLQMIRQSIDDTLKATNQSRTFHARSLHSFMAQSNVNTAISLSKKVKNSKDSKEVKEIRIEQVKNENENKNGNVLNLSDSEGSDQEMSESIIAPNSNTNTNAPLQKRIKKKPQIMSIEYRDMPELDNSDNNQSIEREKPKRRKRTYSDMVSTSESESDTETNVNIIQPNIVTLNLSEINKKTKKKSKKATRVRVDAQQSSLDYYWKGKNANNSNNSNPNNKRRKLREPKAETKSEEQKQCETESVKVKDNIPFFAKKQKIQKSKTVKGAPECVTELTEMIDRNTDSDLKRIFESNVYVGCVDNSNNNKGKAMIGNTFQRVLFQYDTKLFLCNIHRISRVYFFEICVKNIGHFRSIYRLIPNTNHKLKRTGLPRISELILLALSSEESESIKAMKESKEEMAQSVTDTLCLEPIAQFLFDYFSVEIDVETQTILSIPCLIDGYIPPLLCLPIFLLRLVTEIEWFTDTDTDTLILKKDKTLFKQISMEIARFYQVRPPHFYLDLEAKSEKSKQRFGGLNQTNKSKSDLGWILQHILFRSMNKKCTKYSFNPPKFLVNDGSIVQLACTSQLYKVFERC